MQNTFFSGYINYTVITIVVRKVHYVHSYVAIYTRSLEIRMCTVLGFIM